MIGFKGHVLVLAGGSGVRLSPLSTKEKPKQFLRLFNNESMLQNTIRRVAQPDCSIDSVTVITRKDLKGLAVTQVEQMEGIGIPIEVFVEHTGTNTAPAIADGVRYLLASRKISPEDLLIICPSDHVINDFSYQCRMAEAVEKARRNKSFVLLGILPTYPDPNYGYLEVQDGMVISFHEKPDENTANRWIQEGNYFWNSGMVVGSLGLFNRALPNPIPSISFDKAVLEKWKEPISFVDLSHAGWSDIGSWESLIRFIHLSS